MVKEYTLHYLSPFKGIKTCFTVRILCNLVSVLSELTKNLYSDVVEYSIL